MSEKISIIGAGPSGLFCALHLLRAGFQVDLYDQMAGPGKKFLVAGGGGLNLTHSEDIGLFVDRYGKNKKIFASLVHDFSPQNLRSWCEELGATTFIGSSGRVFPESLKAADILLKWISKLKEFSDFNFYPKHRLKEVGLEKVLSFEIEQEIKKIKVNKLIFALGGASWKKTGSDGLWLDILKKIGIKLSPFVPMNCGFETSWSDHFIKKAEYQELKNISLKVKNEKQLGELMLTPFGVEGGAVYALSNIIRDEISKNGESIVFLDLKPDLEPAQVIEKLKRRRKKDSLSNSLRKNLKIEGVSYALLKEILSEAQINNLETLATLIKNLPIKLNLARPIDEAISTGGGVCFEGLSQNLEILAYPDFYVTGEMLDFEAPTGGYLLQACFSTAYRVSETIINSK